MADDPTEEEIYIGQPVTPLLRLVFVAPDVISGMGLVLPPLGPSLTELAQGEELYIEKPVEPVLRLVVGLIVRR